MKKKKATAPPRQSAIEATWTRLLDAGADAARTGRGRQFKSDIRRAKAERDRLRKADQQQREFIRAVMAELGIITSSSLPEIAYELRQLKARLEEAEGTYPLELRAPAPEPEAPKGAPCCGCICERCASGHDTGPPMHSEACRADVERRAGLD